MRIELAQSSRVGAARPLLRGSLAVARGRAQKKLEIGHYSDTDSFASDLRLIWSNCFTYNKDPNSDVCQIFLYDPDGGGVEIGNFGDA